MSDRMTPPSFSSLLMGLLKEYKSTGCFLQVPVKRNAAMDYQNAIGPAAGPHTQLAGNILAAYGAGASHFELKTVQILEGEALGIVKPCIYAGSEVFNTEWSTELTVEEALSEYVKAYLLLKILIKELNLGNPSNFSFIMSVGYNLEGIQSPKIDSFIESMKDAKHTAEWMEDLAWLRTHLNLFEHVEEAYLDSIPSEISKVIALSTMHGCKSEEIERIAAYLLEEKHLDVYVKMNPTLLGEERVRTILNETGYEHIVFDSHNFKTDISLDAATEMIQRLLTIAKNRGQVFGVKLTNTFPVKIEHEELTGDTMYLSGEALYPLSIGVAALLAERFSDTLPISYSGGADQRNIQLILATGIYPVTVSSLLLKAGGYKNLTSLVQKADAVTTPLNIDTNALQELARTSLDGTFHYREKTPFQTSEDYTVFCSACNNCVDVCPNRANRKVPAGDKTAVIHVDRLCNECGACSFHCIKGHDPYKEKFTLFSTTEDFNDSKNPGAVAQGNGTTYRLTDARYKELADTYINVWEEYAK